MISSIPCVILSGGRSSRMGEDKSLLPFKGFNTLIEYQYNKLSKIFTDLYISTKEDKFDFIKDDSDIKLIYDDGEIFSPMVALKSIFKSLDSNKIFIITVDTPFIYEQTIKTLIEKSKSYDIVIAKDDEKTHNLCGVFSKKTLQKVEECLNNDIHKINYLLRNSQTMELSFHDKEQFLNLNTPEEYKYSLSKK